MNTLELDDLELEAPCRQCGGFYRLPLKTVMTSQQMMHEGCPVTDERECPPVFYSAMLDEGAVEALGTLLARLGKQASGIGGRIVARVRPEDRASNPQKQKWNE